MALLFIKGSSRLHNQMLLRVMYSPMVFFEMTPVGRILNRFSKDMDESKRGKNLKKSCFAKVLLLDF